MRDHYELPGLAAPVQIIVDRFGVAHIRAGCADDVFRAQGWNAARDRLWQLDFWRRRGLGLLAEVFGEELVERDRAARLFTYRGDMRAEWLAYGSDTKRVATAFTEGVNAWIDLTEREPDLLAVEFREVGYRPARWEPADLARIRSHGLSFNVEQEVARARTLHEFGAGVEDLRRVREPPVDLEVPEGLELGSIPDEVLRVYRLAKDPPLLHGPGDPASPEGSNNWVVAGSRTATGRPLLANDPHRALSLPSLRYLVHLTAPGLDVIGGGEPALPGISIGHNGHIAFGLTVFAVDQEDLYVYETQPGRPREYRYADRYEPMRVVREAITVQGRPPVEVELLFSRHGPVVHEDAERGLAYAVRAAWLEPGTAPYLGSMDYMRARDWDGFLAAMNRWGAPGENQLYADPAGRIAWKPGGLVPRRPNWDGLLPVPGDGRYEWSGFADADELPVEVDPERGFIATANEMNLPEGHPSRHIPVGFEWSAPTRVGRIREVLGQTDAMSVADCVDLQNDVLSLPARRLQHLLAGLDTATLDGPARAGRDLLLHWDARLTPDSAPAALFEVWYRFHLRPTLLRRALGELVAPERVDAALVRILPEEHILADPRVDLDLLERPRGRLGRDDREAVAQVLRSSLAGAVADLGQRLGPDPAGWSWGALHTAALRHPLAPLLSPATAARLQVGPDPRGGSGDVVGNTAYGPDLVQTAGATFRLVIDVGDWDASVAMNSPGQSGDPDSPHATDLWDPWLRGEDFPLCYSREQVEAHAERRILLLPGPSPA